MKKSFQFAIFLSIFFIFFIKSLNAQEVQRHETISNLIYNFASNLEWENENIINEYNFLIISQDKIIIEALTKLSNTKELKNKPIKITVSSTYLNSYNNIHLVFAGKEFEKHHNAIFEQIEGKNILLVSDNYSDKSIIMMNFLESGIKTPFFEINKNNILNKNFEIIEDVKLIEGTEINLAQLYRDGQSDFKRLQLQNESFEKKLSQLENSINIKSLELKFIKDSLDRQSYKINYQQKILENQFKTLKKHEAQLKEQINKIKIQQNKIGAQAPLILKQENEIKGQIKKIKEQQDMFKSQSIELQAQKNEIEKGNELLKIQKQEIFSQSKTLAKQGLTIHRQRYVLFLFAVIIVLVVIMGIIIYSGYKHKQKMNIELELRVLERTMELNKINQQLKYELVERHKAEAEVQELNKTLELRIKERTAQLSRINIELESYSYSISHDLRTPLRAILGFSQILNRRYTEALNEEGQQYLNYIIESSVRMEELIKDLLAFSKLGRNAVTLHQINLNDVIRQVHIDFKEKIDEINANFITEINLPVIQGDNSLLNQIFSNLFENAIKYRRKEVNLIINVSYSEHGRFYRINVADNGIGIAPENQEKIFNIFQRLHTEEEYDGTGIGLATVKKAVNLINGNISVQSQLGKGSIFIVELPK